jgi:hypothetical protein
MVISTPRAIELLQLIDVTEVADDVDHALMSGISTWSHRLLVHVSERFTEYFPPGRREWPATRAPDVPRFPHSLVDWSITRNQTL